MSLRDILREELAMDMLWFEASGGKIEQLPPGESSGKALPFNVSSLFTSSDAAEYDDVVAVRRTEAA